MTDMIQELNHPLVDSFDNGISDTPESVTWKNAFREKIHNIYSIDTRDRINLVSEAKEKFGANNWKKELFKMAADGDTYRTLLLMEGELSASDLMEVTKLLANPLVSKNTDSSTKANLIEVVSQFSDQVPPEQITEVVENLKAACVSQIEFVGDRMQHEDSLVSYYKSHLVNTLKALILIDNKQVEFFDELAVEVDGIFGMGDILELADIDRLEKERNSIKRKNFLSSQLPKIVPNYPSTSKTFLADSHGDPVEVNRKFATFLKSALKQTLEKPHPDQILSNNHHKSEPIQAVLDDMVMNARNIEPKFENKVDQPKTKEFGVITEKEATDIAVKFFKLDMAYMYQRFESSGRDNMRFRSMAIRNPTDTKGVPIMITRPDLEFDPDRNFMNGSDEDIYHYDIWKGWEIEAGRHPDSERAKLFNFLNKTARGENTTHLYMKLTRDKDGKVSAIIRAGWMMLFEPGESTEYQAKNMSTYGVDAVRLSGWDEDGRLVETLILEDIMAAYIAKNAEKLATIVSPQGVKHYKHLATRFLTDPEANKVSRAYQDFMEYQRLINEL